MSLSVGRAVVVLLEILKHSQTVSVLLSTGTRAGQQKECCAEDSVEDVSLGLKRNLWFRFFLRAPTVETVHHAMVAALDIDRVSANSVVYVVQYVGEVGLQTSDVLQELSLLHLLNRQPD